MTTITQYRCNLCPAIRNNSGKIYGLAWRNNCQDFKECDPHTTRIHVCGRCMSAIKRVEINQAEPETPAEDPPSEPEEPGKPAAEMTLDQAREFANVTEYFRSPELLMTRFKNAAKIIERELTRLEAQATTPRGVLEWRGIDACTIEAVGRCPEAGAYRIQTSRGTYIWEVWRSDAKLYDGTLYDCMAWCEALGRGPEAIPFGTSPKDSDEDMQILAKASYTPSAEAREKIKKNCDGCQRSGGSTASFRGPALENKPEAMPSGAIERAEELNASTEGATDG